MNLSKSSVKGLGVLVSGVLIFGTGLFVVNPLLTQRSDNMTNLTSMQKVTDSKTKNLERLSKGAVNFDDAFRVGSNFQRIVPKSKDIESASRAISSALTPGVTITSFTFGSEEPVADDKLPALSLNAWKPPSTFAKMIAASASGSSSSSSSSGGSSSGSSLNRLPAIVSVSASSYQKLSEYTDKLAKEERLIEVNSISANSKDGTVKADIYAYAFIDKTS